MEKNENEFVKRYLEISRRFSIKLNRRFRVYFEVLIGTINGGGGGCRGEGKLLLREK